MAVTASVAATSRPVCLADPNTLTSTVDVAEAWQLPTQPATAGICWRGASAVAEELDRLAKIAELDAYLTELDAELGPLGDHELAAAREWADQLTARPNTSTQPGAA